MLWSRVSTPSKDRVHLRNVLDRFEATLACGNRATAIRDPRILSEVILRRASRTWVMSHRRSLMCLDDDVTADGGTSPFWRSQQIITLPRMLGVWGCPPVRAAGD